MVSAETIPPLPIPVFLNGRPVSVPPGTTLQALVDREAPELGAALGAGEARATDARGIAVSGEVVLWAGAIFRVFQPARGRVDPADA